MVKSNIKFLLLLILILAIFYLTNFLLKNKFINKYDYYNNIENDISNKENNINNLEKPINQNKLINLDLIGKIKKIYLWQCEREDNALQFMYKPGIISILNILKEETNNSIEIDYRSNNYKFDEIQDGDLLIWVGLLNVPDFDALKKKNIYTIYYNTEPTFEKRNSDEIWTYSKYLFDNYDKSFEKQIIKFIPIICEENIPHVPYYLKENNERNDKDENNIKLIFIGSLNLRQDKKDILMNNSLIKNNLEEIYNLWDDNGFNNFIKNKPNIYLNLTKTNNIVLPSFRLNKLLSHKSIIISERTNNIDEEYYKDMIYFCDINEIENIYKKLINKTNLELQNEANEIYKKFYDKFNIKNSRNLITSK